MEGPPGHDGLKYETRASQFQVRVFTHDISCFLCTPSENWHDDTELLLIFELAANRFLYHLFSLVHMDS